MNSAHSRWSKGRYTRLLIKEYFLSALGRTKEAYLLRYERDSLIPRSTPAFLLDYLEDKLSTHMKVLDIACGDGDLLDQLKERSVQAFGMDFSPARTLLASLKGREVVQGDMHCLPFRPCSFDVIIASEILQQTTRPEQVLREWAKMIRENGFLVIMMANIPAFRRKWLRSRGQRWKLIGYWSQYQTVFTRSSFVKCINSAGLYIDQLIDHPASGNPEQWIAICRKGKRNGA